MNAELAIAAFDTLALIGDSFARGIIFAEVMNAFRHGMIRPMSLTQGTYLLERARLGSVVLRDRRYFGDYAIALLGWKLERPDPQGAINVPGVWVTWPPLGAWEHGMVDTPTPVPN